LLDACNEFGELCRHCEVANASGPDPIQPRRVGNGNKILPLALMTIQIEEFKPMRRNSLLGFARVRTASGVVFHDVSLHCSNGRYWAAPAARPQLDRTGQQMRDAASGKNLYVPTISFASKEVRDRFSAQVIEALRAVYPAALELVPEDAEADMM
jgi:hypothetical protein